MAAEMLEKMKNAAAADLQFFELTVGYTRKYHSIDRWGMREGDEKEKFVEMDRPIPCSYNARRFYDVKTKEWYTKKSSTIAIPQL